MLSSTSSLLLSIEASRPAFMMVMGLFLLLVAWRLVQGSTGWAARFILSGALLLAFGYAVLVPLYEAGLIQRFRPGGHFHGNATAILGWHVVKLFSMNAGWFLFGIGLALHARVFVAKPARSEASAPAPIPSLQPIAINPVADQPTA